MALSTERDTQKYGAFPDPEKFELPVATLKKHYAGGIVCDNGSGYMTPGATATGLIAMGVCTQTADNSTGLDGAINVKFERGAFWFANSAAADEITIAQRWDACYIVDDQTVAKTDGSATRSRAGLVLDVDATKGVLVLIGAAQTAAVSALETAVSALQTSELTAQAIIPVPLGSFFVYSTGAAIVAFNDGVADGIDPTAESIGYKFNVASTAKIAASVPMPMDLNDAAAVVVHVLGFRVGASDTTAALTVGAFFRVPGAAFSADADAGGDTDAFAAATTVVSEVTRSIAHGDVPAAPASLLLTLVPTAALDADDLVVTEVWLEYTRKLLTS